MIENFEELEKNEAKRILKDFNIPINWLGYKFAATAIPYVIEKICSDEKIVFRDLYKYVSQKHKTTANKVDYAIRYLHENTDIAKKLNEERLTNQTLLLKLADLVMQNLNM